MTDRINKLCCLFVFLVLILFSSCSPRWLPAGTVSYDEKTHRWGYYSLDSARWIIQPQFREFESFNRKGNALVQDNRGYWGVIDRQGNYLTPAVFTRPKQAFDRLLYKDSCWGLMQEDGVNWTPLYIDEFGTFRHNRIIVRKGEKYGLMNRRYQWVAPAAYRIIEPPAGAWKKYFVVKDSVCGYMGKNGKASFTNFSWISESGRKKFRIAVHHGKEYLINRRNKIMTPDGFDAIEPYHYRTGYTLAYSESRAYFLNQSGGIIKDVDADSLLPGSSSVRSLCAKHNGRFCFFDMQGNWSDVYYDSIVCINWDCWENYFAAKRNDRWCLLGPDGKQFVPGSWKKISLDPDYSCDKLLMRGDDQTLFVKKNGKSVKIKGSTLRYAESVRDFNWKPVDKQ